MEGLWWSRGDKVPVMQTVLYREGLWACRLHSSVWALIGLVEEGRTSGVWSGLELARDYMDMEFGPLLLLTFARPCLTDRGSQF